MKKRRVAENTRKALWGSSELGALFEDYVANLDLPISELFDSGATLHGTLHVTDPGVPGSIRLIVEFASEDVVLE